MKFIVLLSFVLLLSACSAFPVGKSLSDSSQRQIQTQQRDLFLAALDQFFTANNLQLLEQFQRQEQDSPLADTAEKIIQLAQKRTEQISSAETDNQRLLTDLTALQQQNLLLSEKIEQLKTLLIDQEQRAQ